MHAYRAVLLICVLLILAMVPWVVSSCSPRPLLPDELKQAPVYYQETADAARTATMAEIRRGDSEVKVVPLGTVTADEADGSSPTTVESISVSPITSPAPTLSATTEMTGTSAPTEPLTTPTAESASVVIVRTAVVTQTSQATVKVVVVRPNSTPDSPDSSPADSGDVNASPAPPQRLVEIEDVITEAMLTEQVKQDEDDASVSDLIISITPDGVSATGNILIFPGIKRPLETRGTFAVENDSLVVNVTSILFDGRDVTELYRAQLEENINWSLYQLLPQRYVKSYELSDGQIVVHSQVKP